jgi:glycosyltransferase involved in cell wall biosynthesis
MQTVPILQKHTNEIDLTSDFVPILIREIELSQPLPTLSAFDEQKEQIYQRVRCLVRLHTQPLGLVDLTFATDELSPEESAQSIWQALGEQINAHLREDGLPEVTELSVAGLSSLHTPKCLEEREVFLQAAPFVSIVISTRDRPDRLARCLPALLAQHYPHYEVIVVDNAPSTSATADFIQQTYADEPKLIYIREDHPGLSWARNRGILKAQGAIIAFTDDDVVVDTYWLAGLVRGFSATENVACVTGLVVPLELDTLAQFLFEAYDGFTRGFSRCIFDLHEHRRNKPAYPYIIGACGIGASMAFTAKFLRSENGFDLALGTGSRCGGGEDHAAFFRAIIHGYRLVYEPTSLAYHQHRRDYAALQKQIYYYGIGLTAYLTKIVVDQPLLIFDYINKFVRSVFFLGRTGSLRPERDYPQELKRLERKGWLHGPWAYVQSRQASGWRRNGLVRTQENINVSRTKEIIS